MIWGQVDWKQYLNLAYSCYGMSLILCVTFPIFYPQLIPFCFIVQQNPKK